MEFAPLSDISPLYSSIIAMPLRNPISPTSTIVCSILVWIAFHFWWIFNKLIGIGFGIGFHLSSFPQSLQSLTWKPSPSLGRHWAHSLWPHTWVCTISTTCTTCTNYKTWTCITWKCWTNVKCAVADFSFYGAYQIITLTSKFPGPRELCYGSRVHTLGHSVFHGILLLGLDLLSPKSFGLLGCGSGYSLWFGFVSWRSTSEGIHLLCDFTISASDPLHFPDPFKLTRLVLGVEPFAGLKSWVHLGLNFHTKKIQNGQMGLIFNTKTRTISGCKNRIAPFAFLVLA